MGVGYREMYHNLLRWFNQPVTFSSFMEGGPVKVLHVEAFPAVIIYCNFEFDHVMESNVH